MSPLDSVTTSPDTHLTQEKMNCEKSLVFSKLRMTKSPVRSLGFIPILASFGKATFCTSTLGGAIVGVAMGIFGTLLFQRNSTNGIKFWNKEAKVLQTVSAAQRETVTHLENAITESSRQHQIAVQGTAKIGTNVIKSAYEVLDKFKNVQNNFGLTLKQLQQITSGEINYLPKIINDQKRAIIDLQTQLKRKEEQLTEINGKTRSLLEDRNSKIQKLLEENAKLKELPLQLRDRWQSRQLISLVKNFAPLGIGHGGQ